MEDIRPELRERLKAISAEQEQLQKQLSRLNERARHIAAVLAHEDEQWAQVKQMSLLAQGEDAAGNPASLNSTILDLLDSDAGRKNGSLDWLVDQIKRRGFPFGVKSAKRVINITLLRMKKEGDLVRHNGVWKLKRVALPQPGGQP